MNYLTNDPLKNPMVITAIRLVYTDKVKCVTNGYKVARYQLTTKQLVAKCVVDKLISQAAMARACGLSRDGKNGTTSYDYYRKWISDYKSGKLRLENACAVRRV